MKASNFVRILAAFLFVISAPHLSLAKDKVPSDANKEQANAVAQQQSLDRSNTLITALDNEGALTVDADGNVKIKSSVIEKLNQQGRLKIENASYGSICQ